MIISALLATALAFASPAGDDCARAAQTECAELMRTVYRSAHAQTGIGVRLIDGRRWTVEPIAIARLGDRRALIVASTSQEAFHAEAGTWSLYLFEANTPRLVRSVRDFRLSGSFGYPGSGALLRLADGAIVFIAEGGGTWQGHSCIWTTIDLITPEGVAPLLGPALISFDAHGAPPLSAEFESLSLTSAALRYSSGQRFTFTPDRAGFLRPNAELPARC